MWIHANQFCVSLRFYRCLRHWNQILSIKCLHMVFEWQSCLFVSPTSTCLAKEDHSLNIFVEKNKTWLASLPQIQIPGKTESMVKFWKIFFVWEKLRYTIFLKEIILDLYVNILESTDSGQVCPVLQKIVVSFIFKDVHYSFSFWSYSTNFHLNCLLFTPFIRFSQIENGSNSCMLVCKVSQLIHNLTVKNRKISPTASLF